MSEYTAEDFKDVRFARHGHGHGHGAKAVRWEMNYRVPWHTAIGDRFSDEQMAENGWVPVVEADGPVVTEGTLRRVEERAERKRRKLIDHIDFVEAALRDRNRTIEELQVARKEDSRRESAAHDRVVTLLDTKKAHEQTIRELRHDLAVAREELADLRDENYRLERILQAPLSLKDLEVAWEAAEEATAGAPIRKGDVVIEKISAGAYAVMSPPPTCGLVGRAFRVLSRVPREPWADLADVLGTDNGELIGEHRTITEVAKALHERGVRVVGGDDDE